jgi:16S rRNA G966 N2-methylase RsmD
MSTTLAKIDELNKKLEKRYRAKLIVNPDLKRTLVSFQANKKTPGYRWYKFKEGYSSALVDYILDKYEIRKGKILDPFAGSGTSLFASAERGLNTVGVELLPIGAEIIEVRNYIFQLKDNNKLVLFLQEWATKTPWEKAKGGRKLNHLKITNGAFPQKTEEMLGKYLNAVEKIKDKNYQRVLRFALLCVLEEISFTRKDGQYLRWDHRSGRGNGKKKFDKGEIKEFNHAITKKLNEIISDLRGDKDTLFEFTKSERSRAGNVGIVKGSCLSILPTLSTEDFDFLMTSPPYCNRYDYTRTYALELALLDVDEDKIRELRQAMMSCTVENRDKENLDKLFSKDVFAEANKSFENQEILQTIIKYLDEKRISKELNNPGIVRMVKNYFYEMALIIFESARLLKAGAPFVMVNDNVRYAGANIPVDLILSDIAHDAGFEVEKIWVLPTGKGNSSQQMGAHGREELRKCVYVWRKL